MYIAAIGCSHCQWKAILGLGNPEFAADSFLELLHLRVCTCSDCANRQQITCCHRCIAALAYEYAVDIYVCMYIDLITPSHFPERLHKARGFACKKHQQRQNQMLMQDDPSLVLWLWQAHVVLYNIECGAMHRPSM